MEQLWIFLDSQKAHLATIAGILTALAVIWKYLREPLKDFFANVKFMYNAKAMQIEIDTKLDTIMLQLVPNGGSSIKDSLDRIEDKQHFFGSFLKTQLDTHTKALFEADPQGNWTWVNRPHSRLTGFQTHEVMGDGWINLVAPECRERFETKWNAAIAAGRELDEDIWCIKTDRRTRYLVNIHAYTIEGRDNAVAGYIGEVTLLDREQTEPVTDAQRTQMDRQTL